MSEDRVSTAILYVRATLLLKELGERREGRGKTSSRMKFNLRPELFSHLLLFIQQIQLTNIYGAPTMYTGDKWWKKTDKVPAFI